MKIIKCSSQGYLRLWNRVKGNMRVTGDEYGAAAELDRIFNTKEYTKELLSPSIPRQIILHTIKGSFCVVRD